MRDFLKHRCKTLRIRHAEQCDDSDRRARGIELRVGGQRLAQLACDAVSVLTSSGIDGVESFLVGVFLRRSDSKRVPQRTPPWTGGIARAAGMLPALAGALLLG